MDALKSLVQPLVGGGGGSGMIDGMKLVVLGGTVETARRVSSSAWYVSRLIAPTRQRLTPTQVVLCELYALPRTHLPTLPVLIYTSSLCVQLSS